MIPLDAETAALAGAAVVSAFRERPAWEAHWASLVNVPLNITIDALAGKQIVAEFFSKESSNPVVIIGCVLILLTDLKLITGNPIGVSFCGKTIFGSMDQVAPRNPFAEAINDLHVNQLAEDERRRNENRVGSGR